MDLGQMVASFFPALQEVRSVCPMHQEVEAGRAEWTDNDRALGRCWYCGAAMEGER